jgi:hypothetical protein
MKALFLDIATIAMAAALLLVLAYLLSVWMDR